MTNTTLIIIIAIAFIAVCSIIGYFYYKINKDDFYDEDTYIGKLKGFGSKCLGLVKRALGRDDK